MVTIKEVTTKELKAKLSSYLKAKEDFIITHYHRPIAKVVILEDKVVTIPSKKVVTKEANDLVKKAKELKQNPKKYCEHCTRLTYTTTVVNGVSLCDEHSKVGVV